MSTRPDIYDECARGMQGSAAWPAVFEAGSARTLAIAAITELRKRGLLNDLGIDAVRSVDRPTQESANA